MVNISDVFLSFLGRAKNTTELGNKTDEFIISSEYITNIKIKIENLLKSNNLFKKAICDLEYDKIEISSKRLDEILQKCDTEGIEISKSGDIYTFLKTVKTKESQKTFILREILIKII